MPRTGGYSDLRVEHDEVVDLPGIAVYPETYKDEIFTIWYSHGKVNSKVLYSLIPESEFGGKPMPLTLKKWISESFRERGDALDNEVFSQVNGQMVAEKVEMLNRHATIGKDITDMAVRYLKDHESELSVNSSVRMLVAGIEIERESRGISTTIQNISKMSDEQLDKEIKRLLSSSTVEIEPIEEEVEE